MIDAMRPTRLIATLLGAVAIAGLVLWFTAKGLRPWTPNIVVGAVASALTITVIDSAVRREERARFRPRLEWIRDHVGAEFCVWLTTLVATYPRTHSGSARPIPSTLAEFLDLWSLELLRPSQAARTPFLDAQLWGATRRFTAHLSDVRLTDRDVLAPALIREIDNFGSMVNAVEEVRAGDISLFSTEIGDLRATAADLAAAGIEADHGLYAVRDRRHETLRASV